MADINDLAQQIAYYQAGGKAPGQSNAEQFNQGFANVAAMGQNLTNIVKTSLEAKKLALEQAPLYTQIPGLQNPADVQKQQQLSDEAQANYNKAAATSSAFPQLQRDTAGTAPEPPAPGPQPLPYKNPNRDYEVAHPGVNLNLTLGQNKDLAAIDTGVAGAENRRVGTNLIRSKIDAGKFVYMSSKDGSVSDIQDADHQIPLQKGAVGVQSTKIALENNKNAGNDKEVTAAANSVIANRAALSQFPGFGKDSLKGQVIRRVVELQPDFDFRKNEANFSALKTYANYINSGPYQNQIKYLESVGPNLQQVVNLSDSIDRSQFPLLNRGTLEAMKQTGDPNVVSYATAVTEVGDQIAKILQGGGTGSPTSDAKIKQAQELLNGSYTPEQIKAVASTLTSMLGTRQQALEAETIKQIGGGASKGPKQAPNGSGTILKQGQGWVLRKK